MIQERWASEARVLDEADPLRRFRERFYRREGEIYLDGNSLGLLSQFRPVWDGSNDGETVGEVGRQDENSPITGVI